jgi:hypothetical protein
MGVACRLSMLSRRLVGCRLSKRSEVGRARVDKFNRIVILWNTFFRPAGLRPASDLLHEFTTSRGPTGPKYPFKPYHKDIENITTFHCTYVRAHRPFRYRRCPLVTTPLPQSQTQKARCDHGDLPGDQAIVHNFAHRRAITFKPFLPSSPCLYASTDASTASVPLPLARPQPTLPCPWREP